MEPIFRNLLPERRMNETVELELDGQRYAICIGFDRTERRAREVFANGPKIGSAMQAIISDACVVISIALQCGIKPGALAKSLGRVPRWTDGKQHEGPASVIGLIVGALEEWRPGSKPGEQNGVEHHG